MATETGDSAAGSDVETGSDSGISPYMRGVIVTTGATLAGIGAAILSAIQASGPEDTIAGFFLIGAILVQFPLYSLIGIDIDEFGTKDYLYILVMTGALWFISWGILLTAGT
jgi:hypothetical protein